MFPASARQEFGLDAVLPPHLRGRIAQFFSRSETILILLVPIAWYVWFIHQYGVNAIWYDQWDNVALLTHSHYGLSTYEGNTSFGMLWQQHNENRMLFPNLIVLALGAVTHFDVLTELFLSSLFLVFAMSLVILAHRRDLNTKHWIIYLPVAFLMLSLGQSGDTLFGFQIAWYLILLALGAVIFLLDSPRLGWFSFVVTIGLAIVGSYSSLQGLLIWASGLVILLARHRRRTFILVWLSAAVVTTLIYFYNFDFAATGSAGNGYLFAHPLSVVAFFFFNVGDVLGTSLAPGTSDPTITIFGVAIFLLAAGCLILYGRSSRPSKSPVGPALICFGLLFAVTVALGRSSQGLSAASQTRYATFNLLTLVGCCFYLLEARPSTRNDEMRKVAVADRFHRTQGPRRRLLASGSLLLFLLVVAWVVMTGAENGDQAGQGWRGHQQLAALVTAHAEVEPDSLITSVLFPHPGWGDNIRGLAEAAKKSDLSFFATGEGAKLASESPPKPKHTAPLTTEIGSPANGAILRGKVFCVAKASGDWPITTLEFEIKGSLRSPVLRSARFLYGFLAEWNTTDLPNGSYTVQSVVHDSLGQSSTSSAVTVTVDNGTH